ncbi:TadE family type IV pilus minor pilin [Bifidobacterium sp. ESL0732]|uniref:TadE family type IV pilus minor pilin n=1 Tax=Bifidobacterium sp. ESL0732 TaxID=2983222 RepID=UPI0023F996FF|nr:TadE family type IV pilus minor pilin [Bifidobacterium sp. ESL0732]WEV63743.1 pilus assembly protein [Bifidobacterium sp. ESL0732]
MAVSMSTHGGWSLITRVRGLCKRFCAFVTGRRHRCAEWSRSRWWAHNDEGAVTAEFAVVLPAVMAMAVLLMMLARAVTVEMNCQDAASAAARVAVVSSSDTEARLAAHDAAGGDASVSISRGFKQVKVTVSCRVVPDPMHVLPMAVVGKATGVIQ